MTMQLLPRHVLTIALSPSPLSVRQTEAGRIRAISLVSIRKTALEGC